MLSALPLPGIVRGRHLSDARNEGGVDLHPRHRAVGARDRRVFNWIFAQAVGAAAGRPRMARPWPGLRCCVLLALRCRFDLLGRHRASRALLDSSRAPRATRAMTVDRQQAFSGTKEACPRCASIRAAGGLSRASSRGLRGPLSDQAIQGRPVKPDLSAGNAGAQIRAAPQAAGQTAAVGACGRSRIPRHQRAARQGFPVAEPLLFCADESIAGTAFYVMGFVDGRVFWEPQMPGSNPAERARGL